MKTPFLKSLPSCLVLVLVAGLFLSQSAQCQDQTTAAQDTVAAAKDNSSSFNDSVQFDDMEPIFYEATEDDNAAEKTAEGKPFNYALYGGIAVVLLIVLVLLKKMGKKKPSNK